MKQKFFSTYDIIAMSRASLKCLNKETGETVYISRNAFNALENAVDMREIRPEFCAGTMLWIEVCVWKS
jgi:hypothetical protein